MQCYCDDSGNLVPRPLTCAADFILRLWRKIRQRLFPIHSKNRIVILTSGWLFEFQHITCMDTDFKNGPSAYLCTWFHLLKHISDAFNHLYR